MSTTAEPGLRERKKAATRQALHDAAVKLATEHGVDRVTVEAIADEAGVSRRTFSNYFTGKEEALMYGDFQRIHALIAKVRQRPADESPWRALTAAAGDYYRTLGDLDQRLVAQRRLAKQHPSLAVAQARTFAELEREVAAEIAARAGLEASGVRVRMMSASFLVALRVAVNLWLEAPPGADLSALITATLAEAGGGFD